MGKAMVRSLSQLAQTLPCSLGCKSVPGEAGTEILMLNLSEETVSFGGHPKPLALSFSALLLFALILTAYTCRPQLACFLFLLSKGSAGVSKQHSKFNFSPLGLFFL